MAITSISKVSVALKLDNGTSDSGNTKTVSVSLGNLNKDAFDADKVMSVVSLLKPCLSKTCLFTQKTEVSSLSLE